MAEVESHRLIGSQLARVGWAVAIARADADVNLYLASGTDAQKIVTGPGVSETDRRSIGDAPILTWQYKGKGALPVSVEGVVSDLPVQDTKTGLFTGLNVGVAIRNGEDAGAVAHWLAFHQTHHGMNGALIVDRDPAGTLAGDLAELVADLDFVRLLVLTPDFPLGRAGLPAEAHPFCAPDAPGKDRMKMPAADRWRAPLGEVVIFELLKDLYLNAARAVTNIDISDLIMPDGIGIFDAAVTNDSGMVMLAGRHCYPWRVRKGKTAVFGDHICVQFDRHLGPRRWCLAPEKVGDGATWRYVRVIAPGAAPAPTRTFMRFMALRHPGVPVSKIVPKSSLIEDRALLELAAASAYKPVRMPKIKMPKVNPADCSTTIVTTMKNEGPFILEWLAYHRVIGVEGFLVYTNDCTDGTDDLLNVLQDKGLVQHRDNGFAKTGQMPQHWALKAAPDEPVVAQADWVMCMDVDEYINIKVGAGTLADLYDHMGDANMISCTWRLFGNADVHGYSDTPIIGQFDRCAPELIRKPHQAWGFKTLFRNVGIFKKLGVHRPKGLNPQLWDKIRWVNGSGTPLPPSMFRNAWRSTKTTYGYDVVSLNHYAVRSAESFLVKRDRGRVNHVARDQGLGYWFRMNNNAEVEQTIQRMLPRLKDEMQHLLSDADIKAAHKKCVSAHRRRIAELLESPEMTGFYDTLTSPKLQRLSRMHAQFGAQVFAAGPDALADDIGVAGDGPVPDDRARKIRVVQ